MLKRIQIDSRRGLLEVKVHLVRWLAICSGKTIGSLGVGRSLNKVLLCKGMWRLPLKCDSFWRKVILGKLGLLEMD